MQQLIHDTLQGYHTTLFAFGQTGAGKTYTMIGGDYGNEASLGIMPRALQYLYFIVGSPALAEFKYSFRINCLEIYNENVFDLFVDEQQRKTSLPVREHSEHGFFVEGEACVHHNFLQAVELFHAKEQKMQFKLWIGL